MGLDFIRRVAPSFKKSLDRRAVALRTPSLFVRDIPLIARSASADICRKAALATGEKLLLRILSDGVVAQRDNLVVAIFSNPPAEFLNHLQFGAGVALGEVKAVHALSEKVEIGICE